MVRSPVVVNRHGAVGVEFIAQLVSSGLSNKELATHCWISPRTVASISATSSPRRASPPAASSHSSTWVSRESVQNVHNLIVEMLPTRT